MCLTVTCPCRSELFSICVGLLAFYELSYCWMRNSVIILSAVGIAEVLTVSLPTPPGKSGNLRHFGSQCRSSTKPLFNI